MDLIDISMARLRYAEEFSLHLYQKPLMITYSGGKDSDLCVALALAAKLKHFEIVHSHTSVDSPDTVRYIRQRFHEWECKGIKCDINYPRYADGTHKTMWNLIPHKKIPPTRLIRYCCSELKETCGKNRHIVTGVRWAESTKRAERGIYETITPRKADRLILMNDNDEKREFEEHCYRKKKSVTNPIIDYSDSERDDALDFLGFKNCNPMYCKGFKRVGCIGCPMANKKRYTEFRLYPTYKQAYIHSFDRMLLQIPEEKRKWQNGLDVFRWWMEEDYLQLQFEDLYDMEGVI